MFFPTMQTHLNTYFGKLITCIHEYGGDIVAFAGDALIAMWVVEEKDAAHSESTYVENMKVRTRTRCRQATSS